MLYLLNNRLDELIKNTDYIHKNKKYMTMAATHLSEEYIRVNEKQIIELIKILYNANDTSEYKKLIALVDRAIYRNKIKGIDEIIG
ncbi:hypothetical protein [Terrisporobacter petrolearius]|uniref:hypothetical protein n=1 Tax=Terrisporobacter petrolearius TaxID=1460447 RepID=UPI0031CCB10B